jgi:peroxiredoxin
MKAPKEMRSINNQIHPVCFRITLFILIVLTGSLFMHRQGYCENNPPSMDFLLFAPSAEIHKQYLGLSSDKDFSLGEIKAQVVIIEIFSMYCPICQRGAAGVNELFRLIQSRPALKDKIKLIGIGAGNSIFEVDFFREKYNVEFPLFSDTDFSIHKKVGGVRTPHFFGLLLKENGRTELFYSRTGEISSPESFLQTIIKESGIKEQP